MNYKIIGYRIGTHKINTTIKSYCKNCLPKEYPKSSRNSVVAMSRKYRNSFVCDQCEKTFQGVLVDPSRI